MIITKKDWIEYFPFEKVRPIQETAIDFILNSFVNSKKRYVVLEAPAGTGKSAIAITVSKYFEKYTYPTAPDHASWVVTTQKILQKQYNRDFPWMSSIWSKSNYQCVNRYGISCQFGLWINSIFKGKNKNYCDCVYLKDKHKYLNDQISLTNTSFMLSHVEYGKEEIQKRKLLVVDECHNLEGAVTDFVSIEIDKYYIKDYGISWNTSNNISVIADWVEHTVMPKLIAIKERYVEQIKAIGEDVLNTGEGKTLLKNFDDIDRYICQLLRAVDRFDPNDWVLSLNKDRDKIMLKPIFASNFCEEQLFRVGQYVLLMSGTILDKETFCNNVGIKPNDADFLSLDSPFPSKNRPVIFYPMGSMSYKNIDRTLPIMTGFVKKLINTEHAKDSGIIHCVSYKVANYLYKNLKSDRVLIHNSENRMEVFQTHITSKRPTILISPSFTEGIDLIGELGRFQILMKVPFPYLGDEYVVTKMKRVKNWYEWNTVKTIIQSSGRSVRDVDDHAYTYLLDSDFEYFYSRNKHLFPKWYKDAVVFF